MSEHQPKELYEQLKEAMKRPEGSFVTKDFNLELFNPESTSGTIFEVITGDHIFLLQRNCDFELQFIHSSPGTETRVATINLKEIKDLSKVFIALIWSTSEIKLTIGPAIKGETLITSIGVKSDTSYRIINGSVIKIGGPGVTVMDTRIFSDGGYILEPTAIETWKSTLNAIEILQSSESTLGYLHETVLSNLTISTLVTGFETYSKNDVLS